MANLAYTVADSGILLKLVKIALIGALLCTAFFIREPVVVKSYIYKVFREASKTRLMWQTRGWEEIKGPHFIVRYQAPDDDNANMVLDTAEKNYQPVVDKFDFTPKRKTLIVIYPTKESLGRSFGWAADESAMGVYWAGVIRVLSPKVWIDEHDPLDFTAVFETEGPMVHEFTHLMVDYATGGNYTRWFTEGIAQFEEEKLTGYLIGERNITSSDQLYPLSRMDREFDNLSDQNLAYFQSYQAVYYLVSQYGEENLNKILQNLGSGKTMDESFQSVLGVSVDRFEHDFQNWIVGQQSRN